MDGWMYGWMVKKPHKDMHGIGNDKINIYILKCKKKKRKKNEKE